MEIPKQSIKWLVDRHHVGDSDEAIRTDVRNRATAPEWTAASVKAAEKYAVKCHRKNQDLYNRVMSGRF